MISVASTPSTQTPSKASRIPDAPFILGCSPTTHEIYQTNTKSSWTHLISGTSKPDLSKLDSSGPHPHKHRLLDQLPGCAFDYLRLKV
ncbi:predicted protein [Sclerotinia sclerotiorum 1980 UF-70]|uniref:Uncharacterized protein n=1 Tax=Sclerotinia sclerotiorum (strain ATCC 18683 / 1980 / Ss-1) TaxID=665079 RepID=A7E7T1_SCLS1|nr:predicted protein [Sclerotinia sclerotiorum 1980 UF-70]EDN96433.1 predicted protein [Sclerotinia sclerotiorum 1980 UF-70]